LLFYTQKNLLVLDFQIRRNQNAVVSFVSTNPKEYPSLRQKVYRNDICPYCDSGLKYKKCECYKKDSIGKYTLDEKHTKGWK
jgi:hypothetical protein